MLPCFVPPVSCAAVGRYTLCLNDVIGLRYHPDMAIWRMVEARNLGGRRADGAGSGAAATAVVATAASSSEAGPAPSPENHGGWRRGSSASALESDVVPTLIIHVPSHLNPGYQDATVEFCPKTMSWYMPRPHSPHSS